MSNSYRRSLIALLTAMALCLIVVASTSAATRRTTGYGDSLSFGKGAAVAGEIISLRKSDGSLGLTYYRCYLPNASKRGRVTSGVINPYKAEVKNLTLCKNTLSSPTPRRPTGQGDWGVFRTGYHVLGYAIEINMGPDGRTYINCAFVSATAEGRVVSGVVNPSRFEIAGDHRCTNTTNWRPGFRKESGKDSLSFKEGDYIVAAYIVYADGNVAHGGNPCHTIATQPGILYGGVRNYWPGEQGNLPAC